MDIIQLKTSDIPRIRKEIADRQENKCLLCGCDLSDKIAVLDHQHKRKKTDKNIVDNNGLVRGVLCSECNALEGKIFNNSNRFLHYPRQAILIEWLLNLIEYYQREKYPYIHPSEKEKEKEVSKSNFNKLKKLFIQDNPKKSLEYPKSKKLNKRLKELFEEYNISPYN